MIKYYLQRFKFLKAVRNWLVFVISLIVIIQLEVVAKEYTMTDAQTFSNPKIIRTFKVGDNKYPDRHIIWKVIIDGESIYYGEIIRAEELGMYSGN